MDSIEHYPTFDTIYREGRSAYQSGFSVNGNPYPVGTRPANIWAWGWLDASRGDEIRNNPVED